MRKVFELNKQHSFEDDKIKISFSKGEVSDALSVYIKDENGKTHHILWKISPDRCGQSFSKINKKIESFVHEKVYSWLQEELNERQQREQKEKEKIQVEENKIKSLIESF